MENSFIRNDFPAIVFNNLNNKIKVQNPTVFCVAMFSVDLKYEIILGQCFISF